MNALQEIGMIVKSAQSGHLPLRGSVISNGLRVGPKRPIDWSNPSDRALIMGLNTPKFDFKREAVSLLAPFRNRVGQHGADALARDFSRQFRDMQANPGKYDEMAQRAMLDQWKSRIAQFERGRSAEAKNVAASQNRQAVVAPKTPASLGTGWGGRQVVQGGNAPTSTVHVPTQANPMAHNAVTGQHGQTLYRNAQGQNVALSELPSMQMMAKWNTPVSRSRYLASYLPGSMRVRPVAGVHPYVAKSNGNGAAVAPKNGGENTMQFGGAT